MPRLACTILLHHQHELTSLWSALPRLTCTILNPTASFVVRWKGLLTPRAPLHRWVSARAMAMLAAMMSMHRATPLVYAQCLWPWWCPLRHYKALARVPPRLFLLFPLLPTELARTLVTRDLRCLTRSSLLPSPHASRSKTKCGIHLFHSTNASRVSASSAARPDASSPDHISAPRWLPSRDQPTAGWCGALRGTRKATPS